MSQSVQEPIPLCRYCGRRLGSSGYFFKCRSCGQAYCFIHRDRHRCKA